LRFTIPMIRSALVLRNVTNCPRTPTASDTSRRPIIGKTPTCGCCSNRWWKKQRIGSSNNARSQSRAGRCARPSIKCALVIERKYRDRLFESADYNQSMGRVPLSSCCLPERRILSLARINWLALGDYRPTAVFDLLFSSCLA